MSNYGHVFVVDNNALSRVKRDYRASGYFKQHCRIPSEVLHEATGFPDIDELKRLEYPTTARILTLLKDVMSTVPVGDTNLVDLYANLGNADPMIIATALAGQRTDDGMLVSRSWIVVSDDKAVQTKAREFDLTVKTTQEFITALEQGIAILPADRNPFGPPA